MSKQITCSCRGGGAICDDTCWCMCWCLDGSCECFCDGARFASKVARFGKKASALKSGTFCIKRTKTTLGELAKVLSLLSGRDVLVPALALEKKIAVNVEDQTLSAVVRSFGLQFGSASASQRGRPRTKKTATKKVRKKT